jgi:hypothetical protein
MTTPPHLGGAYERDGNTWMPDVFGYLLVKYEIKSILDIGCGFGGTLSWFAEHGLCQIKGIEGDPACLEKSLVPGHVVLHDFTKGPAPVQPFVSGPPSSWSTSRSNISRIHAGVPTGVMPSSRTPSRGGRGIIM